MNNLTVQKQAFPMAQVDGANSLEEVIEAWKARGLEPLELTAEQTIQRVVIEYNPLKGEVTWTASPNMDGLGVNLIATETMLLMPSVVVGQAVKSICQYFSDGDGRIDIGTGKAVVIIAFENGRLAIDWQPKDAPIAMKKLLAMALIKVIAKDAGLIQEEILNASKV